jgi:hypothetical protein
MWLRVRAQDAYPLPSARGAFRHRAVLRRVGCPVLRETLRCIRQHQGSLPLLRRILLSSPLSLILSPPSSRRVVFRPHHRRSLDFAVRRSFPSDASAVVVRSHFSVIPGLHPAEIRSDPIRSGSDWIGLDWIRRDSSSPDSRAPHAREGYEPWSGTGSDNDAASAKHRLTASRKPRRPCVCACAPIATTHHNQASTVSDARKLSFAFSSDLEGQTASSGQVVDDAGAAPCVSVKSSQKLVAVVYVNFATSTVCLFSTTNLVRTHCTS